MSGSRTAPPQPAAPVGRFTEALVQRLGRQALFEVVADSLQSTLPFDILGLARLRRGARAFEVSAHIDRRPSVGSPRESSFSAAGTVGAWVASRGTPFVGSSLQRLKPYPHTYASLIRQGMASTVVVPVAAGRDECLVLYALASRTGAFREDLRERYLRAVDELAPMLVRAASEPRPVQEAEQLDQSLDAVQARHIQTVLQRCAGVIEGEQGAARELGIKPSTLRHRIQRLGIKRS